MKRSSYSAPLPDITASRRQLEPAAARTQIEDALWFHFGRQQPFAQNPKALRPDAPDVGVTAVAIHKRQGAIIGRGR